MPAARKVVSDLICSNVPLARPGGLGVQRTRHLGTVAVDCSPDEPGLSVGPPKNLWAQLAILVGDASYAIYLTHFLVMISYAKLLKSTGLGHYPQAAIIPIIVFFAVVLGGVTHFLVERPALAVIRNFMRMKSSTGALIEKS
jgi:hypothetical protein